MSDEHDKPDEQAPEEESTGPRGGERLAEARREQQISVLEVAKELHLDEPKVRALERNDFETLGAPVFAKGHLRKYAQLVGVDPDDIYADYYHLTRSESLPPVVVDSVADEAPPPPVEALPEGEIRISLSFTGDCWTEISDATGRRLFFEMGREGRDIELTGRPPFAVLLGNVENVSVRVSGEDYPVAAANPGSRTARLTIVGQ
jgi:cytoskeletal protein RodZ